MSSSRKAIFIFGVLALMLVFVWLFGSGGDNSGGDSRPYVSSNWNKKFQPFDKDPLGLYFFHTLAHSHLNSKNDIYDVQDWVELDSLMTSSKKPKTFLFVGNIFGMNDFEMDSIMASVSRGSDLFLSYNVVINDIMRNFFDKYEEKYEYGPSVNVFTDKLKCEMINIYQNDTIACEWNAFGEVVTKGRSKSLSSFMEMDNFIEIKMGKGKVLLHTNPSMFHNYQIKRKSGYKYTEYVLSQLPRDQDILLLELGRRSDNLGNSDTDEQDGGEGKKDTSYLKIIFENPTLLTALLLSIFGVILFVTFRSKRVRPIVPYQDDQKNMTLAFAETITSIYFSKRNPYGLLQVQRKNFYDTIHKHFFVDLNRRDGDRELIILAEKSNKSLEEIKGIVAKLETKEAFKVSEQDITNMAQRQRTFYREVGIIPESVQVRVEKRDLVFRRGMLLPTGLIMAGLFSIFIGLYYLVSALGIGIALWPVGIILFLLGVIRLSNPFMKVSTDKITYYTSFGKKKVFDREHLISTEMKQSGVVLRFTDNRILIINYWDLSRFDRNEFDGFIAKLHTLEL